MKKSKLTQVQIDEMVFVNRVSTTPSVFGVGVNDCDFQVAVCGKMIWQYALWKNMLKRCFYGKFKATDPAYKDVTCCNEWLSFANFLEWVNKEVGYSGKPVGFELDKDLIIKGNKVYSPEVCCFVPKDVNVLLNPNCASRGDWPVGVSFRRKAGGFKTQISCNGFLKHVGLFDNPEDAFAAYKIAKEAQIKVVAMQYKDVLKPAVFESLMNWEILSDD